MNWITTTKNGQWTNVFRSVGTWLHEVGLAKRLRSRLLALRPACRSALVAERVNFADVAPLLGLTIAGAILSLILLGFEIIFYRWKKESKIQDKNTAILDEPIETPWVKITEPRVDCKMQFDYILFVDIAQISLGFLTLPCCRVNKNVITFFTKFE